ncbi:MAG: hypothetical protein V2I35_02515 [Desulfocapsaceae bacterium]|nr:hypothetical protein [Desulfocapsaceae bacterium]
MIRGTREWAVAEIDCSIGCPYDCRYCYARTKALKNRVITSADEWKTLRSRPDAVVDYPLFPGQVMFPASHDIISENLETCICTIDRLLARGNRVLVVSKPSPEIIARLCDEFAGRREQLLFRFTITARNPRILAFWEPGAPCYSERRASLALAADRGFDTSVSIEPMLESEDIFGLVDELLPFVSHSIWIGLMNRIAERVTVDSATVEREVVQIEEGRQFSRIMCIYNRLKNNPLLRWKESIKNIAGLPEAPFPGMDI